MAHLWYLHLVRTSWGCSLSSSWELEHTALVLCVRVLITLYVQARLWYLSHWKYKSVWVGFLYTLVVRVPSCCGVTSASSNSMEPSGLVSSVVNMMEGSTEIMCCKNTSLCDCSSMKKVSSTFFPYLRRVHCWCSGPVLKWLHVWISHTGTHRRPHGYPFGWFIKLTLEQEVGVT